MSGLKMAFYNEKCLNLKFPYSAISLFHYSVFQVLMSPFDELATGLKLVSYIHT